MIGEGLHYRLPTLLNHTSWHWHLSAPPPPPSPPCVLMSEGSRVPPYTVSLHPAMPHRPNPCPCIRPMPGLHLCCTESHTAGTYQYFKQAVPFLERS